MTYMQESSKTCPFEDLMTDTDTLVNVTKTFRPKFPKIKEVKTYLRVNVNKRASQPIPGDPFNYQTFYLHKMVAPSKLTVIPLTLRPLLPIHDFIRLLRPI